MTGDQVTHGDTRSISVVIPTYNRRAALERALKALAAQRRCGDAFEVVVVSDGSTDGTDDLLTTLDPPFDLKVVRQPNQGPAAARNAGVHAASGELVLFLDDDMVAAADLVAQHLAAHQRLGAHAAVIGPMLTPPDHPMSPWVRWEQAKLERQYRDMLAGRWSATARQFFTGNASVARRHVLEVGGFDSSFLRAEDVELAYRMGRRGVTFHFEPLAGGHHYAERSYASWLAMARSYGRSDVRMYRSGESWLLPTKRREYDDQHRLVRWLTAAVLGSGLSDRVQKAVLARAGGVLGAVPSRGLSMAALSSIFALEYYRGVAIELGGWHRFLATSPTYDGGETSPTPRASIVVPAHNEGLVIARCLETIAWSSEPGEWEVVVVANGCDDDTAEIARSALPTARVIELPRASKVEALNTGDRVVDTFPRVYLDADVVVDAGALRSVVDALRDGSSHCAAPRMVVELSDRPWYVRAFYQAFMDLPYVREGLVGNGFYALSEKGRARFDGFPDITADDLFVRNLFEDHERVVVEDRYFCMFPPRTWSGLVAIRRRVYRGNAEYQTVGHQSVAGSTRSWGAFLRVALKHPVGLLVYLWTNIYAQATWRQGGGAWERDDSGRRT